MRGKKMKKGGGKRERGKEGERKGKGNSGAKEVMKKNKYIKETDL